MHKTTCLALRIVTAWGHGVNAENAWYNTHWKFGRIKQTKHKGKDTTREQSASMDTAETQTRPNIWKQTKQCRLTTTKAKKYKHSTVQLKCVRNRCPAAGRVWQGRREGGRSSKTDWKLKQVRSCTCPSPRCLCAGYHYTVTAICYRLLTTTT
jgi:hypothetical protein